MVEKIYSSHIAMGIYPIAEAMLRTREGLVAAAELGEGPPASWGRG